MTTHLANNTLGIVYALTTIAAWGTWLAPSQNVRLKNQQIRVFYVASVNLVLAFFIALIHGAGHLQIEITALPFTGGLIWSLSGLCAFTAANKIGMAKAFGIWAPLNIVVSFICGIVLFHEFAHPSRMTQALVITALATIVSGVLLIIFAKSPTPQAAANRAPVIGYLAALAAGVLWGIYYIPIKLSGVSLWNAALPMAVGIFVGSGFLALLARESLRLDRRLDYLRVGSTGLLWSVGNYGMLLLVGELGAAKGYTLAQLSVVANAMVGIYVLHDPAPRSRAAKMMLVGCLLAIAGGILLGKLK
jgi:glucose uptake protein